MFPTFISILDIQSWWEVPSIAHFCSLFRTAFNLLDFDIEDLEEALLTDGTEESSWLQELIVLLLKGCLPNNDVSLFNYQMFLRRLFRHKCLEHNIINPFNTDIDFQLLPLRVKVDILHALCDFRLEADDVLDQLKNLEADSLRVEPLGHDANRSAYWYFYGTRLYREDNPKSENVVWQVICFTLNDWEQLVEKLKKSKHSSEKQLHQTLLENFIPELPRLFKEKESLARKRLLERAPRRSSNRLKTKVEEEEKEEKKKQTKLELDQLAQKEEEKRKEEETRKQASKRRKELIKKRERSGTESQSDSSEIRYEMAGAKSKDKKNKNKHSKETEGGGRSGSRSTTKAHEKKQDDIKTVGRQTNNSLASATGQILIQPVSNPHRKKLKTSQVFSQTDEDLETGLHKILNHVKNHDDAWPFIDPVEEEYAPNYYSIIRKPMDLQRMEERLDSGHYKTFSKFKTDFQLIVNNCRLYNGIDNEYTEMVDNLQEVFNRAVERYLDQITSSDDEIAVEYPEENNEKSNKRKRTDSTSSPPSSKRKPTLAAQTDRKKERSPSEESLSYESVEEEIKPSKKPVKKDELKKEKSKLNKKEKEKESLKPNKKHKEIEEDKKKRKDLIAEKICKKTKQEEKVKKHEEKAKTKKYRSEYESEEEQEVIKPLKKQKISSKEENKNKSKEDTKKKIDEIKKGKEVEKNTKNKKHKEEENIKHKKRKEISEDEEETKSKNDSKKKVDKLKKIVEDKKHEPKKQHKSALLEKKKPGRKPKIKSPTVSSERNRSLSKDRWSSSPPPSWPPSSPEQPIKKSNKHEEYSSDEEIDNKGKYKQKNNKWKEIFKEDDLIPKENSPPPPKHKDKHDTLSKTIEKLKAKSDLTKLKEKDLKVFDFENEKSKENQDIYKTEKSKIDLKRPKKSKKDDYEDENSTAESYQSEIRNSNKKVVKNSGVKNNAAIEALTLATEQTLKDINKWLDDTPRFTEFSSASNSPSHFSNIDEFDSLSNSKIEPVLSDKKKLEKSVMPKKDGIKDIKKRPFQRDPTKLFRRREVQRTIDRLQPGKSKGNLISNVQNNTKTDELFPLGPLSKIKDTKNSLIVKTDESAPKLSLGSVLDSFGKHKFVDDEVKKEESKEIALEEKILSKEDELKKEVPKEESIVEPPKLDNSPGQATPNLSAWFKAFGAPKVQPSIKKTDSKEEKDIEVKKEESTSAKKVPIPDPSPSLDSPLVHGQPISRQRKISTGSSMSERSSFSQDMDSPRVGIDERLGAYPAPYPSPLHKSPSGASPNLRSPLPEVSPKSASYPFNGQIHVGFYQDTVSTKSSPDKSCSPRDNPQSPYTQYSEHVYTPQTNQNVYSYNSPYYSQPPNYSSSNPTPPYNQEQNTPPSPYYDTHKSLTDQYQPKNVNTPVNISTPNSPAPPQQQSSSLNQQQPSPNVVENFKKTGLNMFNQQNSPSMEVYQNSQTPESFQIDSPKYPMEQQRQQIPEVQKFTNPASPVSEKYHQQVQEDLNKLNQSAQQMDVYNQASPNMEIFRSQGVSNVEGYRQQQAPQTNQGNENFRNDLTVREKPVQQQQPTTFPVKKRAYTEIEQSNRFDEHFNRANLEMGIVVNRMPSEGPARETPKYIHQNIPEPRQITTQQSQNQETNSLAIRNYPPSTNPYNYNESYPINIPTTTRNLESERKMDMSKYTNMGYTGSEINFARNTPQQYTKTEINYSKPNVPSSTTTEQHATQRFPDNNVLNITGYKAPQPSHLQSPNVPESTTNTSNNPRLENVSIPRPTYSSTSSLEMDQTLGLRGPPNLTCLVDRYQNDERIISGLQSSTPSYFGDKNMSSQHMFTKPIATSSSGLPMFSQPNAMPYNIQSTSSMYSRAELQNSNMLAQDRSNTLQQQIQEKKSKRKKASKSVTPPTSAMESTSPVPSQGFQSYTGIKNSTSMEPSAISLKTASVVPGSAFNFGPSATGLGLGSGLYGDKDAYPNFLEDFRSAPNYYMAAAAAAAHHRSTPDNPEKQPVRAAHQASNPQAPNYPFIGPPQARPSYPLGGPFIPPHQSGLMDASSPLYQQYLQAGVLHQGLLGPPGAYPPGYHPALSMRQPYETMTRPSWL